jgi:AcrR family transcriptional regulator
MDICRETGAAVLEIGQLGIDELVHFDGPKRPMIVTSRYMYMQAPEKSGRIKSADKRQSILDGALTVFLEQGFQGASMDRIAQEAGVSKQTIYSHFKDKETLFTALIEVLQQRFCFRDIAINALTMEPADFLTQFARLFLAQGNDPVFLGFHRIMVEERTRNAALAKTFVQNVMEPGTNMMATYMSLHPKLKAADAEATARVFLGALSGFIYSRKTLRGEEISEFEQDRYINILVNSVLAGLKS